MAPFARPVAARRRLGSAIALASCLALGCARPAVNTPAPISASAPVTFVSDRGDSVAAERGTLLVPEDRRRPDGRKIELSYVRLRSTSPTPGAPIVYLAGGPGGSAQLSASGRRFPAFMRLREVADVILFDQRGTYGSNNLSCPGPVGGPPDSVARSEAVALEAYREWSRACVQHWSGQGVALASYDAVESADDVEALRRALGVPRLSLWAISYGTQLAQVIVRRHPRLADYLILAGSEPLDAGIKLPSETDLQLARVDSALRLDAAAQALVPSLTALVDSVHRLLDRRPARVVTRKESGDSSVIGISRFEVQSAVAFSFGNSAILRSLPQLYLSMANGEFAGIAPLVLRLRHLNSTAMTATTDCATGAPAKIVARARDESTGSHFGMAANFPFPELCTDWPSHPMPEALLRPVSTDIPTLFIVGTMDGRTPPANVDRMRPGFSRSRELVIEGGAHDDDLITSDPAIVETMIAFLRGSMSADRRIRLAPWTFPMSRR